MFTMLEGWKTYIVMVILLAGVFVEKALGVDIPGFEVQDDWFGWVLAALGLGALGHKVDRK